MDICKVYIATLTFAPLLTAVVAGTVHGQNYPNKPVRIVTAQAGGGADTLGRIIAQALAAPLGQQVLVDNRGGGVIPPEIVAKSAPDGYTTLLWANSLWLVPYLQSNVPFDPVRDFVPISLVTRTPQIIVVHPSLPVKSVQELIALAKGQPGALTYAIAAIGSTQHIAAELFKSMAGVNMLGVPYKSEGAALIDTIGGNVLLIFGSAAGVDPHLKSGRLKGIAVTSLQKSALFPNLPTVTASGLPGYEAETILGMFAPAKTPVAIVNQLNREITRVLTQPEVKDRFLSSGVEAVGSSPEQFAALIKSEMGKWGKLITDLGIRVE